MPCPQYVRTTEQPFCRAIGSLYAGRRGVCQRVVLTRSAIGSGKNGDGTHITLPRSRKSAPGLQILIDSSRHLRAVRMSR